MTKRLSSASLCRWRNGGTRLQGQVVPPEPSTPVALDTGFASSLIRYVRVEMGKVSASRHPPRSMRRLQQHLGRPGMGPGAPGGGRLRGPEAVAWRSRAHVPQAPGHPLSSQGRWPWRSGVPPRALTSTGAWGGPVTRGGVISSLSSEVEEAQVAPG